MTPTKFKSEVQAAYSQAMGNTNTFHHYIDQSDRVFHGARVFGREAGIDLNETSMDAILQEAIQAARAKRNSLALRPPRSGNAAFAGMVETLGAMTGLLVMGEHDAITITWAKDEPSLY